MCHPEPNIFPVPETPQRTSGVHQCTAFGTTAGRFTFMSNHKEGLLVQGRPVQEMDMHDNMLLKKWRHGPRVRGFTGTLYNVCFRYLQDRSATQTVMAQPIPFPPAAYVQCRLVSVKWDSTNATTIFSTLIPH